MKTLKFWAFAHKPVGADDSMWMSFLMNNEARCEDVRLTYVKQQYDVTPVTCVELPMYPSVQTELVSWTFAVKSKTDNEPSPIAWNLHPMSRDYKTAYAHREASISKGWTCGPITEVVVPTGAVK